MRTLIRGGIVVNSGSSFRADVLLEDQTILALGEGFTAERVCDDNRRSWRSTAGFPFIATLQTDDHEAGEYIDFEDALAHAVRDWFVDHFKTKDARLHKMLGV